ncbi:hypothetical protein F2Q70_00025744 [Brassica cretica]|uniref:Uncharacterized protein n=1 Tax=Brassica cretica TaxID=69181 RepID=A0A8S9L8Q8_BRACR|nr:hypothetical protein F2Q70_00025744 [Brassica cretica]KAF3556466.1 hypothetical protein F2Q69_00012514 [Brassica cretica]
MPMGTPCIVILTIIPCSFLLTIGISNLSKMGPYIRPLPTLLLVLHLVLRLVLFKFTFRIKLLLLNLLLILTIALCRPGTLSPPTDGKMNRFGFGFPFTRLRRRRQSNATIQSRL